MQPLEPLFQVADLLAKGFIPSEAHAAIRLGATVSRSPLIRGIVVGDFVRRLVARPIAQQASEDVEKATKTFQFALRTRAGCECVGHVLDTLAEMDENAALLSVDGVGAFDLISRKSTMEGLLDVPNEESCFHLCASSTILRPLSCGRSRGNSQLRPSRGGERTRRPVDAPPLQPGQHRGLCAVAERLRPGEQRETLDDSRWVRWWKKKTESNANPTTVGTAAVTTDWSPHSPSTWMKIAES